MRIKQVEITNALYDLMERALGENYTNEELEEVTKLIRREAVSVFHGLWIPVFSDDEEIEDMIGRVDWGE